MILLCFLMHEYSFKAKNQIDINPEPAVETSIEPPVEPPVEPLVEPPVVDNIDNDLEI